MALRAGYYGIKNALLKKLQGLSDALVIKSIGEGLDLSAAGELSNTSTGGVDYSTTEQDTGLKWTDGKNIYKKTYRVDLTSDNLNVDLDIEGTISEVIKIEGVWTDGSGVFNFSYSRAYRTAVDIDLNNKRLRYAGNVHGDSVKSSVTIYYTKAVSNNRSTKKK